VQRVIKIVEIWRGGSEKFRYRRYRKYPVPAQYQQVEYQHRQQYEVPEETPDDFSPVEYLDFFFRLAHCRCFLWS
jgi:hypothetical protein